MGISLQGFDLLLTEVKKMYSEEERKRLSKRSRQREIGAGRRFALSLRDRVLLLLFYSSDTMFLKENMPNRRRDL